MKDEMAEGVTRVWFAGVGGTMSEMALTVEATFENGVFVPVQRPALGENERVRLTVERINGAETGGGALAACRRIVIDPELAREIGSSPAFHPDET